MLTYLSEKLFPASARQPANDQPHHPPAHPQTQPQPQPPADCPLCRLTGTLTLSLLSLGAFKEAWQLHGGKPAHTRTPPPTGRVVFLAGAGLAFAGGAVYRWFMYTPAPTSSQSSRSSTNSPT